MTFLGLQEMFAYLSIRGPSRMLSWKVCKLSLGQPGDVNPSFKVDGDTEA